MMEIDGTYRIKLGSLKNIDIWPSYKPKLPFKTSIFQYIRAYVFWTKIFNGNYSLSIGDFNDFLNERSSIFMGKMSVAATVAPKGLGPQDPTKNLAQWVNHYLKNMFSNFRG